MFCPIGLELFEQYETAEKNRNALSARKQAALPETMLVTSREMQAAKQKYIEKFADWLGHKAFCQDCKPKAPAKGDVRSTAPGR